MSIPKCPDGRLSPRADRDYRGPRGARAGLHERQRQGPRAGIAERGPRPPRGAFKVADLHPSRRASVESYTHRTGIVKRAVRPSRPARGIDAESAVFLPKGVVDLAAFHFTSRSRARPAGQSSKPGARIQRSTPGC